MLWSGTFFLMIFGLAEMETGQSLGKEIKGLIPVKHAHPNILWASPKMLPVPGQNLMLLEEVSAVLNAPFTL